MAGREDRSATLAPSRIYVTTVAMEEERLAEFDNGDDVTDGYKYTMVKHAADSTEEAGNSYPVAYQPVENLSLTTPEGFPAALTSPSIVSNKPQRDFSAEFTETRSAYSSFEESSNPYLKIGSGNSGLPLKKGKQGDPSRKTITELYTDLENNREESVLATVIGKKQAENNIWSEATPYAPPQGNVSEEDSNVGRMIIQRSLGVHSPRKFGPAVEPESQQTTAVRVEKLKNMGLYLLLGASGEYYEPSDIPDVVNDLAAKASSLAPGLARLGLKVPTTRFEPTEIMSKMDSGFTKPELTTGLAKDAVFSYGNVNSPLAPFSTLDSQSAIIASELLIVTLTGILEALSSILDSDEFNRTGFASAFGLQSSNGQRSLIVQTTAPFHDCVRKGFEIMVGVPDAQAGNIGQLIAGSANTFNQSPGYYSTLLRMLVRSITNDIANNAINAIANPVIAGLATQGDNNAGGALRSAIGSVGTPSGRDINYQVGISGDVSNIMASIQKMFDSRIVRFINIAALIGDQALTSLVSSYYDPKRLLGTQVSSSILMALPGVGKFKGTTLSDQLSIRAKTPFGTSNTPSMYVLPEGLIQAKVKFGSTDRTGEGRADFKRTSRISQEDVIAIEKILEASYVPFYFHDLRTNEIISFHAFLGSLTDEHSVDHTSAEGYGRIGAVPIYKNTNRSISFDFDVVATNTDDFNEMWWKINKLVTMVYPQYTEGRRLSKDGQNFIQPFSQIPAASPVIRLRIGDVIKGNYDKFNLARLFGVTKTSSDVFNLDNNSAISANREEEESNTRLANARRDYFDISSYNADDKIRIDFGAITGEMFAPRRGANMSNLPVFIPEGGSTTRAQLQEYFSHNRTVESVTVVGRYSLGSIASNEYDYIVTPDGTDIQFVVRLGQDDDTDTHMWLRVAEPTEEIIRAFANRTSGGISISARESSADSATALQDFFSANNNGIVKSFESVRGRGLAGVIKSINFPWIEGDSNVWNTGEFNERAPMRVKIAISFTPIHDISPGLDSDGFNTAPIYGVGGLSTQTKKVRIGDDPASESEFQDEFSRAKIEAYTVLTRTRERRTRDRR